jgi:hypothetical protein
VIIGSFFQTTTYFKQLLNFYKFIIDIYNKIGYNMLHIFGYESEKRFNCWK